ncbi:MAG: hypothetical protein LBR32_01020 [Propionibacteriaceae bacterium]|nr:hypothetical protein [Propionibacteriaceae bacterium]
MSQPKTAVGPRWAKWAIAGVVVAAIAAVWAMGGFNQRTALEYVARQPGDLVDLNVLEYRPLSAAAYPAKDSTRVDVYVYSTCRNTTDTVYLESYIVDRHAVTVYDSGGKGLAASSANLFIGNYEGTFGGTESFNPTEEPLPCRVKATFDKGLEDTATIRVVARAVEPSQGHFSTIEASGFVFADNTAYDYELPLALEEPQ